MNDNDSWVVAIVLDLTLDKSFASTTCDKRSTSALCQSGEEQMKIIVVALLGLVLAGCVGESRYVSLPGYAFKTEPGCKRHEPPSKFDPNCDCPAKGIKDFTPPPCPL